MWMLERRNICTQKRHKRPKKKGRKLTDLAGEYFNASLQFLFVSTYSGIYSSTLPPGSSVNFRKKSVGAKVVDKVLTRQPDAGLWEHRDSVIRRPDVENVTPPKIIS